MRERWSEGEGEVGDGEMGSKKGVIGGTTLISRYQLTWVMNPREARCSDARKSSFSFRSCPPREDHSPARRQGEIQEGGRRGGGISGMIASPSRPHTHTHTLTIF